MKEKILPKIVTVFILIIMLAMFREALFTNSSLSKSAAELMGAFPFSKLIFNYICKICGYADNSSRIISVDGVFTDFIKLIVMSILRPPVSIILTGIFNPLPATEMKGYEYDDLFKSPKYMIKDTIIKFVVNILLAVFCSKVISEFKKKFTNSFGGAVSTILLIVIAVFLLAVSIIILGMLTESFAIALKWRLAYTLIFETSKTLVINIMCIVTYVFFVGDNFMGMFSCVMGLIILTCIFDVIGVSLRKALVG